MGNVSKYYLAEQIRFKLSEGYPAVLESVQQEDVIAAIGQKINSMLKMSYIPDTLQQGDTIPTGLMMATYEDIPVVSVQVGATKTQAKCTLPTQPVTLPRNMGVYQIDDEFGNFYIPLQTGQSALLDGQPLICDLLGQIGYEVRTDTILFKRDITLDTDPITSVSMLLVVMDIDNYDIYTALPIPAEYATQIIDEVYKSFLPVEQMAMQTAQASQQPLKEVKK